jgi:hypothetical protein
VSDPAMLKGWDKRPDQWELEASVQHQLLPRVGMEVGYFRRWYGNFTVTDNLLTSPSDYTKYSFTAPVDARLPDGGGYLVDDNYNLNPDKVGQVSNFFTLASNYGKQIEHWNGVDINFNLRPKAGMLLQGGMSTGRTTTDNCDVVTKLDNPSPRFCHVETAFLTQVKFLGTYLVPKVDVQVAATYRSLPGPQITASYVALNSQVQSSLGRPLSGGAQNVTVNVVEPGTMYGEQTNLIDLRFSKIFRFSKYRTSVNFDLANAFNSSGVTTMNNNYAAWQVPTGIHQARLAKISANFDF